MRLSFYPPRRLWQLGLSACVLCGLSSWLSAQSTPQRRSDQIKEPVFRTAATTNSKLPGGGKSPLDPAIEMARRGLTHIQSNIRDYTCVLVKRERVGGVLNDHEYMYLKVRNRKEENGMVLTPLSVYMYFLKPASVKGREVIYVQGQNNDKLCAHEGGTKGKFLPTVWLKPDSALAMRGQLYPITEIGIENLVAKLIERGQRERAMEGCEVSFKKNATINGRSCTMLEVKHPERRPDLEFYIAQIFIDDELQVPIRYAAYGWPEKEGESPPVLEEYTYLKLQVNVGLKDTDFDTKNPNYNF